MFDIGYILLNSYIVMIPILIFSVTHTIYTIVKARKAGIVRMVYPTVNGYFIVCIAAALCFGTASASYAAEAGVHNAYINDFETSGTTAFEEHYDHEFTEREVSMIHTEIYYHSKKADSMTAHAVLYAFNAAIFIVLAATCGAFITKDGVLIMGWFSPERPYAVVKNGKICFYDETEPGKLFLKLSATDNNFELCKDLIRPEISDSAEPFKLN